MMVYISRIKEPGGPGCGGISMKKVFIDGSAGTTGLRIFDRLQARSDIQLLTLPEAERKDEGRRRQLLNEADVAFLCLPDAAAEEAASWVENPDTVVLEMGMNHFGEMAYLTSIARPDIAIITNIGTMHIEHLGSREGILQAKLEIFRGVPKNGVGVFNGDEPLLWNVRADGGHKKYYFGIENHACDVLATDIQELEDGMRFVVSGFGHRFELFVPVLGRHTVYNALAAVTAALLLKIPPETIQAQISGFQNTGMRQKIYERDGFTIIEDCYNAGPESTEAALDILAGFRARAKGRCIAVLGDMLELGNRSAAEHYRIGRIAAAKVDMLYTYGTNSERMVSGAITGGMKQKFVVLPSISSAAPVRALQRTASSAVKISPLAMTGMRTASRTARMLSQSARPE